MSRPLVRGLLTALLLLGPVGTWAAAPDAAAQLRSLEQAWLRAARDRDTATLDRLLAKDFVHIAYTGRVLSKRDALQAPVAPSGVRQTLSQLRVRTYGHTGIVTGLNTATTPSGAVAVRLRFTDVFVRSGRRWQVVSAQETAEQPRAATRP
ncbi:MAG TPA: nuclear transport factor 2 family protein [Vicinamibacterales bacterium]|nr:nuclear transport factor 2 family protein [Vicinamibacterales bacterium]